VRTLRERELLESLQRAMQSQAQGTRLQLVGRNQPRLPALVPGPDGQADREAPRGVQIDPLDLADEGFVGEVERIDLDRFGNGSDRSEVDRRFAPR